MKRRREYSQTSTLMGEQRSVNFYAKAEASLNALRTEHSYIQECALNRSKDQYAEVAVYKAWRLRVTVWESINHDMF